MAFHADFIRGFLLSEQVKSTCLITTGRDESLKPLISTGERLQSLEPDGEQQFPEYVSCL